MQNHFYKKAQEYPKQIFRNILNKMNYNFLFFHLQLYVGILKLLNLCICLKKSIWAVFTKRLKSRGADLGYTDPDPSIRTLIPPLCSERERQLSAATWWIFHVVNQPLQQQQLPTLHRRPLRALSMASTCSIANRSAYFAYETDTTDDTYRVEK